MPCHLALLDSDHRQQVVQVCRQIASCASLRSPSGSYKSSPPTCGNTPPVVTIHTVNKPPSFTLLFLSQLDLTKQNDSPYCLLPRTCRFQLYEHNPQDSSCAYLSTRQGLASGIWLEPCTHTNITECNAIQVLYSALPTLTLVLVVVATYSL